MVNKPFNMKRGVWHEAGIAEIGAMRALGWLVAREDLVEVFLGSTGARPTTCGRAPRKPNSWPACSISS
jgi:hypothetical protein